MFSPETSNDEGSEIRFQIDKAITSTPKGADESVPVVEEVVEERYVYDVDPSFASSESNVIELPGAIPSPNHSPVKVKPTKPSPTKPIEEEEEVPQAQAKKKLPPGRGPTKRNFTATGGFDTQTKREGKDLSNGFYRRSLTLIKRAEELYNISGARIRVEVYPLTSEGISIFASF